MLKGPGALSATCLRLSQHTLRVGRKMEKLYATECIVPCLKEQMGNVGAVNDLCCAIERAQTVVVLLCVALQ